MGQLRFLRRALRSAHVGHVHTQFCGGYRWGHLRHRRGAIIAPFFVSFFGLPIYTVAGAALMGTFVTSVAGVIFYQAIAPFYPKMSVALDWFLGLLSGIGGTCEMHLGARFQKVVLAKVIK